MPDGPYGTEVRPWPEKGYDGDHRWVFASRVGQVGRWHVTVQTWLRGRDGEWAGERWEVGYFVAGGFGDYWHDHQRGRCRTREQAVREGLRVAGRLADADREDR